MAVPPNQSQSALLTLTVTPGKGTAGTGTGVTGADIPTAGQASMAGPGTVTLAWTIAEPLSAATAQLTHVGPLGSLSGSSATYTILESTSFVLTCFAPDAPMQTYVAQVDVAIPSLRNQLVPSGLIGAWHTESGGTESGWQSLGNTLAGRFLLGANITSTSGPRVNSASHCHGMATLKTQRVAKQTANHTHSWPLTLVACDGNESQIQAYQSPFSFAESGSHQHQVDVTATPQATTTDATPTPLPPYYVVKFAEKQ